MNSTILKSLLITFVILFNVFAFYKHIHTEPLLMMHLALAIAILVLIFLVRKNKEAIINLMLLFFLVILFKSALAEMKLPMLPAISPERIVLILLGSFFAFEMLIKKRRIAFSSAEIAMIFFSIYVIFSMIVFGTIFSEEGGIGIGVFLNAFGIPFIIFIISKNIINDESKIKKFYIFLSVIGLYLGLTGIFEYYKLRQFVFPSIIMAPHLGVHWGRARGPFLNAAINGTVVGMILFILIHLITQEKTRWKKMFFIISAMCALITLVFSLTRGCWIAFLIALFVVSVFSQSVRKIAIPSFIALAVFSFFLFHYGQIKTTSFEQRQGSVIERIYGRTTTQKTVTGRFDLYKLSFEMFLDRPFFGYGYGGIRESKKEFIAHKKDKSIISSDTFITREAAYHDTLLGILIDLGLVGIVLMLFIIFYILNACMQLYGKLNQEAFIGKDFVIISLGALLVFLIKGQSSDLRYYFFPNGLFFAIAGIIVGLNQRIAQRDKISRTDKGGI